MRREAKTLRVQFPLAAFPDTAKSERRKTYTYALFLEGRDAAHSTVGRGEDADYWRRLSFFHSEGL
jgi:hypothetical protein